MERRQCIVIALWICQQQYKNWRTQESTRKIEQKKKNSESLFFRHHFYYLFHWIWRQRWVAEARKQLGRLMVVHSTTSRGIDIKLNHLRMLNCTSTQTHGHQRRKMTRNSSTHTIFIREYIPFHIYLVFVISLSLFSHSVCLADSLFLRWFCNHKMSTTLTLFELSIDNAIKYLCYSLEMSHTHTERESERARKRENERDCQCKRATVASSMENACNRIFVTGANFFLLNILIRSVCHSRSLQRCSLCVSTVRSYSLFLLVFFLSLCVTYKTCANIYSSAIDVEESKTIFRVSWC